MDFDTSIFCHFHNGKLSSFRAVMFLFYSVNISIVGHVYFLKMLSRPERQPCDKPVEMLLLTCKYEDFNFSVDQNYMFCPFGLASLRRMDFSL